MGEIIQLPDVINARRRLAESAVRRQSLERALEIIRLNVVSVLTILKEAPACERAELLQRAERLIGLLRYGTRVFDDEVNDLPDSVAPSCTGQKTDTP
jgi:hypothetical protein